MSFSKELILFFVSLVFAYYHKWTTTDLIWSFWTASLTVGYTLIIVYAFRIPREIRRGYKSKAFRESEAYKKTPKNVLKAGMIAASIIPPLFIIPFFTVHFGGFHFVHSMFLNQFYPHPVLNDPAIGQFWIEKGQSMNLLNFMHDLGVLVQFYWPLVLASAINEVDWKEPEEKEFKWPPPKKKDGAAMFRPYIKVIKMHLLIFMLAGMQAANWEAQRVYLIVFAVFFFPFGKLKKAKD
jgi:hypothetical protein